MTENVLLQSQLSNVHCVVAHCHYARSQVVLACSRRSQIIARYTIQAGLILPKFECAAAGVEECIMLHDHHTPYSWKMKLFGAMTLCQGVCP